MITPDGIVDAFFMIHPIVTIAGCILVYTMIQSEKLKGLFMWISATYIMAALGYAIRGANHLFFLSESMRAIDVGFFITSIFFCTITISKIYMFSAEYGFAPQESTKSIKDWVKEF